MLNSLALFGRSMRTLSPLNAFADFTRARQYENISRETLNALSFHQNPFISLLWLREHALIIDILPTRNAFQALIKHSAFVRFVDIQRFGVRAMPSETIFIVAKSDNGSCISLWVENALVILAT